MTEILNFIRENHLLSVIEESIARKCSKLHLSSYEMTEIPPILYRCIYVERLYLHKNNISTFPVQITTLLNLTTLTLDYNNIKSLPAEICNLKNLVNLNISYNPLCVLIPEIGELENLEAFWCNKIGLKEIPKEIGKLSKLDTFGARGNELKSIPEEMTKLTKLRWLTLENNQIETLPNTMDNLEALVHCNLRYNNIKEFPASLLKCGKLMFLQLSHNQISSLPEDFNINTCPLLEVLDLRANPICDLPHPNHNRIRYTDKLLPKRNRSTNSNAQQGAQALAANATALRLPAVPDVHGNEQDLDEDEPVEEEMDRPMFAFAIEFDASSDDSSEDWENSVNSSDLNIQYYGENDRAGNGQIGMMLPELSRYSSTAS